MRANTPQGSVVFAWWDYGYWITALGDRRTLADNGTQNSTQIAVIAQTFLSNTTFVIPTLKRYNVSYVAIFITPGGQSSSGGGQSYQGFGEDGKWYWMARIGNGTLWNYQNHNYKILFLEKSNPQAQTSTYYRVIQDATTGKTVSNDTITDNNEPNDATMLGWMMTKGTLQSGGTTSPFDSYFTEVFHSSNNYVLLFQASYPSPAELNLVHINGPVKLGQNVSFSGNLTDADGNPIPGQKVGLEFLDPNGQWTALDVVTVTPDGLFNGTWTPTIPGNYTIRAEYPGISGRYFDTTTQPQGLEVQPNTVALTLSASKTSVSAGQTVTLTWTMTPLVKDANITLSYSSNNQTSAIGIIPMTSPTMNYTWTVPVSGTITITASWTGNDTYGPAQATVVINKK